MPPLKAIAGAALLLAAPPHTAWDQSLDQSAAIAWPLLPALERLGDTSPGQATVGMGVVALAMVAFLMRTGRLEWRMGVVVIAGSFILFGATAIVSGIEAVAALHG